MNELGAKARWYTPAGTKQSNPYWFIYNRLNSDARNRFMMNANLRYEFTDWLNVDVKVGSDFYNTKTEGKHILVDQLIIFIQQVSKIY